MKRLDPDSGAKKILTPKTVLWAIVHNDYSSIDNKPRPKSLVKDWTFWVVFLVLLTLAISQEVRDGK